MLNKLDPLSQCLDVVLNGLGTSRFSWIVWVNKLDQMFSIKFDTWSIGFLTGKPLDVVNMIQNGINITCLCQTKLGWRKN